MSVEVEIKLKIEDPEQLIEKLEGLGFIKGEQLLESDTYFTSENHDFVKLGEALRVRQIRNVDTDEISAVITYKGKKLDDCSMAREELELEKHFFNGLDSIRCRCWKKSVGISGEMR